MLQMDETQHSVPALSVRSGRVCLGPLSDDEAKNQTWGLGFDRPGAEWPAWK
jgi:hypothetical protein